MCLQAKLLIGKNESISDFIVKVPEAPSPMVIKSAIKMLKDIGKSHALKKYNQFALNTSYNVFTPVVKFHEIFDTIQK